MRDTALSPEGNGHSTAAETIYALSDEQILDIADDASLDDASVMPSGDPIEGELGADPGASKSAAPLSSQSDGVQLLDRDGNGLTSPPATKRVGGDGAAQTSTESGAEAAGNATPQAPPEWLAQAMADPQRGGEARQFWKSAQSAQRDSAAYRATFPTPHAARDAASRAEQLASLDRAYFGATGTAPPQLSASREALAQQLLQENPGAFREMLAAGLRAVGVTNTAAIIPGHSAARPPGDTGELGNANSPSPSTSRRILTRVATAREEDANLGRNEELQQYATFERAANEELDRAVHPEIARILERALPASRSSDSGRATQERLAGMVRNEIEFALKQDRALGEQVAQLLGRRASAGQGAKAQRFDESTRAQVVRLIAARAASLVPSSARRVLGEWTQSALSAHRERNSRGDGYASRARASTAPAGSRSSSPNLKGGAAPASTPAQRASSSLVRTDSRDTSRRGINYRALSDEDILNL